MNIFKYAITLAYNGKNYHGWQIQNNARTVQGDLQNALSMIFRQQISVVGAGRTDAGVHAAFYVANFDLNIEIVDFQKLLNSLNGIMGKDIVIFDVFPVSVDFNSRFSALSRTYIYIISKQKTPFINDFSLFFPYNPDIKKMNEASEILKEYDDFKSFEKLHSDNKTSKCFIFEAKWVETENMITFKITADRFLRNMVRSIVGTMLETGMGKITTEQFREIIESRDRSAAGVSVEPHGLFLTDIKYPKPVNDILEYSRKKSQIQLLF